MICWVLDNAEHSGLLLLPLLPHSVPVAPSLPENDSLLLSHLLPLAGRVGPEELRQDEPPGEAPDQDPVGVEPGQADGGEEGDPDADDVGQVEVGVVVVRLSQGVSDHPVMRGL